MTAHSRDPVINAINDGMRRGITVAVDNACFGPATILIYSAIDAMAFLGMPQRQQDVTRRDFIGWSDRYIRFPCVQQLSGADLYGARCGMLHNYSAYSRMTRRGDCRIIGYMDQSVPEVRYDRKVAEHLVLVSVPALRDALFQGMDEYLPELFSDPGRAIVAEERLKQLTQTIPYQADGA